MGIDWPQPIPGTYLFRCLLEIGNLLALLCVIPKRDRENRWDFQNRYKDQEFDDEGANHWNSEIKNHIAPLKMII